MSTKSVIESASSTSSRPVKPFPVHRRHDLDNLRTCLTGLVIVHHASISFSGLGSWPYKSTNFTGLSIAPAAFEIFNQSFFMGLFFWISGRGSAQSLASAAKKSGGYVGFVKAKLKRLVLPAVIYSVCVDPLVMVLASAPLNASWAEVGKLLVDRAKEVVVSCKVRGPVWYLVTLAMLDIVAVGVYAFLRALRSLKSTSPEQIPANDKEQSKQSKTTDKTPSSPGSASPRTTMGLSSYRLLSILGWIPVGLTCFALRLREPVLGMTTPVISLQLGFAPQYVYAYVLGLLSVSHDESRMVGPLDYLFQGSGVTPSVTHPESKDMVTPRENIGRTRTGQTSERDTQGTKSLLIATTFSFTPLAAMIVLALLLSRSTTTSGASQQLISKMWGPRHPLAITYAMWNEFSFVLMGPALMGYFQKWHSSPPRNYTSGQTKKASFVTARNAYAAFLVHAPVTVAVTRMADIAWLSVRTGLIGSKLGAWLDSSVFWNMFLGRVFMTTAVGFVSVHASFFTGNVVLEWLPGAKAIL